MSSTDKSKTFGLVKQVYPEPSRLSTEGKNNQPLVDIVAVHGLNGHYENTFTRDGHFWLKDSLPVWISQSRVFTYSYNSDVFIQSNSNLSDWSQKLLSSLETKRIKDPSALVEAKINPKFQNLRASVAAIFFLGTPHQGSEVADYASVLASITHAVTGKIRSDALKILKRKSPILQELTQQFRHDSGNFKILSFYEQRKTHGKIWWYKIVDKTSALSNLQHEEQIPVETNHTEICRFAKDEEDYDLAITLREHLSIIFESIAEKKALEQQKIFETGVLKSLMPDNDGNAPMNVATPYVGTCSWILQHPMYQAWSEDNLKCLWIQGGPGYGKSVLSSFILENFRKEFNLRDGPVPRSPISEEFLMDASSKTIVAHFFCDDREESQRTSVWILRSLLHQAFSQNRNLLRHILRLYQQFEGSDFHPETVDFDTINHEEIWGSFERLRDIWVAIAIDPEIEQIYFVVDGLDQWGYAAWDFLNLVNRATVTELPITAKLRCVFTSRPNEFIQRKVETPYIIQLAKENQDDINTIIVAKMKRLQDYRGFNPGLCQKIETILRDRSGGMFLWVCLALDRLNEWVGISNEGAVETMLRNMPSSLNAVYEEVLTRVSAQNDGEVITMLNKILMWSYFAGRNLKLDELQIVLSLRSDDKLESQVKERYTQSYPHLDDFRKSLLDLCGPLVTIQDDGTILLAHQSVKDFLSQFYGEDNQDSRFAKTPEDAHAEMASVCITYLSMKDIYEHKVPAPPLDQNGSIDTKQHKVTVQEYLDGHNFLQYSVFYLGNHLRALRDCDDSVVENFNEFFSNDSAPLKNWAHAYDLMKRWKHDTGFSSNVTFLSVASRLDLTWLANKAMSSKGLKDIRLSKINIPDNLGWLPIHLATDSESVEMLGWLLDNGAAVDAPVVGPQQGLTALHIAAAKRGDNGPKMVKILLEKQANVLVETASGKKTPLHSAIKGRSVATVKMLSSAPGANPNLTNRHGLTALHMASSTAGLHEVVAALLDQGADIEGQTSIAASKVYREALAISTFQHSFKKMLSSARDLIGSLTPLHIAAQSLGTALNLEALLNKGANHSAIDGQGCTALHMVAQGASSMSSGEDGKRKTEFLLASGADVNARDWKHQTPLHKAVSPPARRAVLEVLLSNEDCDVNARDKKERTPLLLFLQTVSYHFSSSIARYDISPITENQGDKGQPQSNFEPDFLESVLNMLLKAGADTNAMDKDGFSVTHYASQPDLAWMRARLPQPEEDSPGLLRGKLLRSKSEPTNTKVIEMVPQLSPQLPGVFSGKSKTFIALNTLAVHLQLPTTISKTRVIDPKQDTALSKPEKKSRKASRDGKD